MTTVTLSLVSHTNAGKTTLARTLLGRDIGEVRDAPHVTEFADEHLLVESPDGHRLMLWDTPGFGDSVRLARRMRGSANPLGWLLGQVWDRWRDRAFWMSQQALRHVREGSDVLLYLVNTSEPEAGYLASEMQLLAWTGKPALVLLNQLGPPRDAATERAELEQWRERLAPWTHVREVLPLDAFARCWVHEAVLLQAVRQALEVDSARRVAMDALHAAWLARREAVFAQSTAELAASLARVAGAREWVDEATGLSARLREWGTRVLRPDAEDPVAAAEQRLTAAVAVEVRASTQRLLALHGLSGGEGEQDGGGSGRDGGTVTRILERVAAQVEPHRRVPEGRAAVLGGALTGALAGLKADVATGGLTLGGGMLAGGILGALGAAGLARGANLVRGTGQSWVGWSAAAMPALTEAALLRYLAVAHYGRGRGDWAEAEAPPHWPAAVAAALTARKETFERLWKSRSERQPEPDEGARLAAALQPMLAEVLRETLARLYPQQPPVECAPDNRHQ
ncbi:MAG: GTPase domain-containing protein [Rubrivivax sp.]|nr:GTPase domain-containing protein [Rubrivivax sp.]